MEKSRLSIIINTIIIALSITLVCYCWINKWLKNKIIAIVLSGFISFVISKIVYDLSRKQINKHNLKKSEQIFAENCITYFSIHPKFCMNFFSKLLNGKIQKNFIITQKEIFYINYYDEIITTKHISEILEKYDKNKDYEIYIFSNKLTDQAKNAAALYNIVAKDKSDVFMIMKSKNMFPIEKSEISKKRKINLKIQINNLIDQKKATRQLFYGILLIGLSFIIPYSFYYIVFGTLFITLGVISIFIKHKTLS